MKRQEVLLNLTLLVIIAALIFFIYESRDQPRGLSELAVKPASVEVAEGDADGEIDGEVVADGAATEAGEDVEDDAESDGMAEDSSAEGTVDGPPGSETEYAARPRANRQRPGSSASGSDSGTTRSRQSKEVADAGTNRGGQFGSKNLFRALLTPTPTPTPPPPTPAPTPDIGKALGSWRLLSVYEGKAMIEDVVKTEQGAEGAIWEMPPGESRQVDVGGGVMKTVTLKEIDAENPYNPEVTFSMEETTAEKKINLDTEPTTAAPKPAPKK